MRKFEKNNITATEKQKLLSVFERSANDILSAFQITKSVTNQRALWDKKISYRLANLFPS